MPSTATLAAHAAAHTLHPERYDWGVADNLLVLHLRASARRDAASSLYARLPSAARELADEARAYLDQLQREAEAAKQAYEGYLHRHGKTF